MNVERVDYRLAALRLTRTVRVNSILVAKGKALFTKSPFSCGVKF